MIVIGLTGSIGMGKSTVASQCACLGARTISADAIVHRLLSPGGAAVKPVLEAFPGVVAAEGGVDRARLGAEVFANPEKLRFLEAILHPLVVAEEERLVRAQKKCGAKWVVLDIPLLYETGADRRVMFTMVASAPESVQARRVLARPGMTREKFARILAQQMPDRIKRKHADFIVQTGLGKALSMRQIKVLVAMLGV